MLVFILEGLCCESVQNPHNGECVVFLNCCKYYGWFWCLTWVDMTIPQSDAAAWEARFQRDWHEERQTEVTRRKQAEKVLIGTTQGESCGNAWKFTAYLQLSVVFLSELSLGSMFDAKVMMYPTPPKRVLGVHLLPFGWVIL
eukprot:5704416-Amphidinium_carterae.1